jgi:hypothetical protein
MHVVLHKFSLKEVADMPMYNLSDIVHNIWLQ